jgi:hypothetical protein
MTEQLNSEMTIAEYESACRAARDAWDAWGRCELQAWCDGGGSPESFEGYLKHRIETEPEIRKMVNAAVAEGLTEAWLDEKIATAIKQVRRGDGGFLVADVIAELKRSRGATTTVELDIMSYQRRHVSESIEGGR